MAPDDDLIAMYRAPHGKKIRLKDYDADWAGDPRLPKDERKEFAERSLMQDVTALAEAQDRLYAADSWSILIIFQAMDAAGKDSTIKHVMSGVNPQGCQVYSFKHPSAEDLDHNFLRFQGRAAQAVPEAAGRSQKALEVLSRRSHRAGILEGLHEGLRKRDQRHQH